MPRLTALLDNFKFCATRLEARQEYLDLSEQPLFEAYRNGRLIHAPVRNEWADFIRSRKFMKTFSRIRLITSPLTPYTRFELEWLYAPNLEAGEEIQVAEIAAPYPEKDFWIFDNQILARMDYTEDGVFEGIEVTEDPVEVQKAMDVVAEYSAVASSLATYLTALRARQ